MAELVLGTTPAATPGVVDGAARDRRLRQLAAIPSSALAQLTATPTLCPCCAGSVIGAELGAINIQSRAR